MAKKSVLTQEDDSLIPQESGFPVPFTLEELRKDILTLFFFQVRTVGWMTDAETALRVAGKGTSEVMHFFNPELDAEDVGLAYADISETLFARVLERMYLFGYQGILDESVEPFDPDGIYAWMSAILTDMAGSRVFEEWELYGASCKDSAVRCLRVAELANARCLLEKGSHLFYFQTGGESTTYDALTVRQMALLAGMEEMSIRAAANPKRANPLPTYSEDGRTYIAIDTAKTWLQAKGRYVPVTNQWVPGDIDLHKRKFSSVEDAVTVVMNRQMFLYSQGDAKKAEARNRIDALSKTYPYDGFDQKSLSDPDFVRELGRALDFPEELFALRVKEALVREELASVERQLQEFASQSS